MIGEVIGSFKIIRFIKSGGMADVYEGQEINIGKKVAIKVLKPNFQNEKDIVNRFYKEGAVLEQLAHPNIVRVLYTTAHHGNPVMIMEYLNGEDLNDYLQQNAPLSISVIETLFLQILDAVIYAHSQNVLHRDIKPSNIFITQSKQIKILDFGIAKILDSNSENTQTGFSMYTPSYMSPEQARAEKNLTAQTDVYSLGVTLYTMAAGTNPYQGLSQFEVGNKVLNEPLPRLTNFSDAFNMVIAKATDKNKEFRYKSVDDFEDEFVESMKVKEPAALKISKNKNGRSEINESNKVEDSSNIKSNTSNIPTNEKELSWGTIRSPRNIAFFIVSLLLVFGIIYMSISRKKVQKKYKDINQVSGTTENGDEQEEDDGGWFGIIKDQKEEKVVTEKEKEKVNKNIEKEEKANNSSEKNRNKAEDNIKSANDNNFSNDDGKYESAGFEKNNSNDGGDNQFHRIVKLGSPFRDGKGEKAWKRACGYIVTYRGDLRGKLTVQSLLMMNKKTVNDSVKIGDVLIVIK